MYFTRDLSRGSDFICGGPVIAESWLYDSCRYLTTPLGHLIIRLHRGPAQSGALIPNAQPHHPE